MKKLLAFRKENQKFQKIADGGPKKLKILAVIGDLYELDNSKQKIFFEKKISKKNFEIEKTLKKKFFLKQMSSWSWNFF